MNAPTLYGNWPASMPRSLLEWQCRTESRKRKAHDVRGGTVQNFCGAEEKVGKGEEVSSGSPHQAKAVWGAGGQVEN